MVKLGTIPDEDWRCSAAGKPMALTEGIEADEGDDDDDDADDDEVVDDLGMGYKDTRCIVG